MSHCLPTYSVGITFLIRVALLCAINMPYSINIYADGTIAGTDISNRVIVNYSIDGKIQEPIESSPSGNSVPGIGQGSATLFKVDRKIDLILTGDSNANSVAPGDIQATVTFTLLNEGNDIQEFQLLPDGSIASDEFDTNNCTTIVTSVTGTPLTGVTLPTSGNIKLSPDQQASISMKCDIPVNNAGLPISVGDTSLATLKAVAIKNQDGSTVINTTTADTELGVETVFADNAGSDDLNQDASHSARRTFTTISASPPTSDPALALNKTIVKVDDLVGGNSAVTGSEVTYKIKITTSGIGQINNVVITDPTPIDMNYKLGSITLDNNTLTDASDLDNADFNITNSNTATINLGNITAGNQHEIQLTYIIN